MSTNFFGPGDDDDTFDYDLSEYSTLYDANISLNEYSIRDLSILCINIVSLPANMNDLLHFLSHFDKKPDIISLTETKITEKSNTHYNPFLENYTFLNVKSKTHFGGVGIFIRKSLTFNLRTDLSCAENGLYEMLWFDVSCNTPNSRKTTVGTVYRHPGLATISSFTSRMEQILDKLNHAKANFYIFGDYNINLIKTDQIHNISQFVNSMHSHGALNMVNKPTRFPRGKQLGPPHF